MLWRSWLVRENENDNKSRLLTPQLLAVTPAAVPLTAAAAAAFIIGS